MYTFVQLIYDWLFKLEQTGICLNTNTIMIKSLSGPELWKAQISSSTLAWAPTLYAPNFKCNETIINYLDLHFVKTELQFNLLPKICDEGKQFII